MPHGYVKGSRLGPLIIHYCDCPEKGLAFVAEGAGGARTRLGPCPEGLSAATVL